MQFDFFVFCFCGGVVLCERCRRRRVCRWFLLNFTTTPPFSSSYLSPTTLLPSSLPRLRPKILAFSAHVCLHSPPTSCIEPSLLLDSFPTAPSAKFTVCYALAAIGATAELVSIFLCWIVPSEVRQIEGHHTIHSSRRSIRILLQQRSSSRVPQD